MSGEFDARGIEEELAAITYAVSHDLRAPLRAISGFSQALLEDCGLLLDETGRAHLAHVLRASERMAAMIDALLRVSRAARAPLRPEPLDLAPIAEDALRTLTLRDPDRSVRWTVAATLPAYADPTLARELVSELVGNAWRFSAPRSAARIEVGQAQARGTLAFFVRDDGIGFDPRFAHALFQPLQRLHGDDALEGAAGGLAVVRRIVRRHGGEIWAEGEPGVGATFWFTLSEARPSP